MDYAERDMNLFSIYKQQQKKNILRLSPQGLVKFTSGDFDTNPEAPSAVLPFRIPRSPWTPWVSICGLLGRGLCKPLSEKAGAEQVYPNLHWIVTEDATANLYLLYTYNSWKSIIPSWLRSNVWNCNLKSTISLSLKSGNSSIKDRKSFSPISVKKKRRNKTL